MHLAVVFVVSSLLYYGGGIAKDLFTVTPTFDLSQGPRGELSQKATSAEFSGELLESTAEQQSAAADYFHVAERHFIAGRYRDAAADYEQSVAAVPTQAAYLNLGISQTYLAEYSGAEAALMSGLQISRTRGRKEFEANFLVSLTSIRFLQKREPNEALKEYREALDVFKQERSLMGQARASNNIGVVHLYQGQADEAIKSLRSALDGFKEINNNLGQARVFLNLGSVYAAVGKFEEALKFTEESLKLYRQLENNWGQAQANAGLSTIYMNQGQTDQALVFARTAVDLHKLSGDRLSLANVLNNQGLVYRELKDLDNSLVSMKAAFDIYEQLNNAPGKSLSLGNIGMIYEERREIKEAIKSYHSALDLLGNTSPSAQAGLLIALGSANAEFGKLLDAGRYLDKALEISTQIQEPLRIGDAVQGIGVVYLKKGQKRKALEKFLQARDIYNRAGLQGRSITYNQELIDTLESSIGKMR